MAVPAREMGTERRPAGLRPEVPGVRGVRIAWGALRDSRIPWPRRAALALAMAGPCGLSPIAPATVGAAAGAVLAWAVTPSGPMIRAGLLVMLVIAGIRWGGIAEAVLGRKDPSALTLDEVAGAYLAALLVPPGLVEAAVVFVSFRVLDALKPPPAGRLQSLPGGWGIVADDLVCALYAAALTRMALGFLGV